MKTVSIPFVKSPENFVRNYVAQKIGNNIRIGKTEEIKKNTWKITLKAVVPSYVKLKDNTFKTFVYVFDDVGEAIVTHKNYNYGFVERPRAYVLDQLLVKKIDELTSNIQNEILDYGKYSWGKLSAVKYWLGSLQSIIIRCLQENSFKQTHFTDRFQKYFEFLESNNWINFEGNEPVQIVASNELIKLHELLITEKNIPENDIDALADVIIGHLYAKHFEQIRDDLKIHAITSYVTITKAYYADAVREGSPIQMNMQSLWLNYRTYNYSFKPPAFKQFRFPKTVAELASNGFLRRIDENHIGASPELFDRLLPYQQELAQNMLDV